MTTPLERGDLGDDDLCPYCEQPQADFSLIYFRQRPVCASCAPILSNLRRERRRAAKETHGAVVIRGPDQASDTPNRKPGTAANGSGPWVE